MVERSAPWRGRYSLSLSLVGHVLDCEIHVHPHATVTHEKRRTDDKLGAYEYNEGARSGLT